MAVQFECVIAAFRMARSCARDGTDAKGPRTCSSTKLLGGSSSVMRLVIVHRMPKCHARQVTSWPSPISPVVDAVARPAEP